MIHRISKKRLVGVVNLTIKESFADALIKNTTLELRGEDGIGSILGRAVLLRSWSGDYGESVVKLISVESPVIESGFSKHMP